MRTASWVPPSLRRIESQDLWIEPHCLLLCNFTSKRPHYHTHSHSDTHSLSLFLSELNFKVLLQNSAWQRWRNRWEERRAIKGQKRTWTSQVIYQLSVSMDMKRWALSSPNHCGNQQQQKVVVKRTFLSIFNSSYNTY